MQDLIIKVKESADFIKNKMNNRMPKVGVILGSGLGEVANAIQNATVIKYGEIPNFPTSTVAGHKGQLVIGEVENITTIMMQGRVHFYEGYTPQEVVFPVRVMKSLGVEYLIITNACGGVNKTFSSGDIVLIKDHVNFTGQNPLIGPNIDEFGPRFPDMTNAYDRTLRETVKQIALKNKINIKEGVYGQFTGPSYETPAEVTYLRTIGVDQVGMSTAFEAIAANHCGMKISGISCVVNKALDLGEETIDHETVVRVVEEMKDKLEVIIIGLIKELNNQLS